MLAMSKNDGEFTPQSRKRRADDSTPPKTCPGAIGCGRGDGNDSVYCDIACQVASQVATFPSAEALLHEVRPNTAGAGARSVAAGRTCRLKCSDECCSQLTNFAPFAGSQPPINQWCCRKPECSYAVLIGVAMRSARAAGHSQRLPVIEIYHYIELVSKYSQLIKEITL